MPRQKRAAPANAEVSDYRHQDKRKNIPPAGLAGQGNVQEVPKIPYSYDPHLPPVLRFDLDAEADKLPELLAEAQNRLLTEEEAHLLADALRNHQPWLEWAGKREARGFEVDPVALHIHERLSTQAILKLAQRQPMQRSLFADPEMEYRQAVQFYQHDMDWTNRLILGDSLMVMTSLAKREDLAGKVQMIYFDPPYGIKFASNFQSQINRRDVRDRDQDLTREPEQVKAYRDTWTLGIHSYLAYLRDRFRVAQDLLTDSGSIFVQISDVNVHRVRAVMDEVFGPDNFVSQIAFVTTTGRGGLFLDGVYDCLLWYSKSRDFAKYRQLFRSMPTEQVAAYFQYAEGDSGHVLRLTRAQRQGSRPLPSGRRFLLRDSSSQGENISGSFEYQFEGDTFRPPAGRHWSTTLEGMDRLAHAGRLMRFHRQLRARRYETDSPTTPVNNVWEDTQRGSFSTAKVYVVQTPAKVIERCILMTTDPGDLVLDPTSGSGTAAYVAEQWGRRWIAIDTSRVANALARQRLLTAKYDYYELEDAQKGISEGFRYKAVPHIMLRTIAQSQALDPVFAKWEPILADGVADLNAALPQVTKEIRTRLKAKLVEKERQKGGRAITDADRRRWLLPDAEVGWKEWEVPFDTDPDWPQSLKDALMAYRQAWRGKMDEVNATITASAPQETLYDQPYTVPNVLRVSGPFTVEGVQPVEEMLDLDCPIGGAPEELAVFDGAVAEPANAEAYLEKMIRLLRQDGVRFPNNKVLRFERLEPVTHNILHAEGEWANGEGARRCAVSFGPQYGPITAKQVEECLWAASRGGYDDLVLAGFTFDGAAQALIQADPNPRVRCHVAHIRPDVQMGDLLKDTPSSQLFTVFGLPRVSLEKVSGDEWVVQMEGVDIYDPVTNTVQPTRADKVAAWFLDSDYDGRTFCVAQAFFPDKSAWVKLARALKTLVEPRRFAAFSGTKSLPFPAGENRRIAVKVIDPRGNEVMRVMALE